MIKFNLICECDQEFDIWFGSSKDFDKQKKRNLLSCPACGSDKIEKALMSPRVTTGRKKDQMVQVAQVQTAQAALASKMKEVRDHIIKNTDNVGSKFPEEARKIHYGETEARSIRGEANLDEAKELVSEGIGLLPVPVLPEDQN